MRLFPVGDPAHLYPRVTSARVMAAVVDVAVGVRLLCPDEVLASSPGYRLMLEHFRADWPLGLALLAFGAVMVAALYRDRFGRAVDVATWLALITWGLVAVDLALVNISQLGTLAYGLVAVLHGYAYAHLLAWREQRRRCPEPTP